MSISFGDIASIVGIAGNLFDAGEDKATFDYNASVARENAERERELTALEVERHKRNTRRAIAEQELFYVSRGVSARTGSALMRGSITIQPRRERSWMCW